ncbi:MAG TPA: methyltransferase domain-containing protein [Thermococcaceae archaeon]|uniref:Cyclopropane-fatty-acyl-phospholipid synthase superfamily n=1 Tax=Thermococcus sibiricus TaxID=172049 RepID=A0A101EKL4_9EURY|nr:class I SAM-dependent methyltransferase [Thermococcus sibiricus]KUK17107.1 MAG: Cyclopropane-fatty-acyl-phospholipid synthase superfamily [Thermococcus sibiricus]KUK27966.1 MAG: Cyclopropane-fatty-acyl-phospholipid synthase superfamily [Thermococcus sp. 40_45]HII67364.1 methyltransferase domain-containing protein [Thermococcaceae archaeon]
MKKHEWEEFFDREADYYLQEAFTKHTKKEIDFLLEEFKLPEGAKILDVGCGVGRHSLELAKRGYRVTGVDISQKMLEKAEERAQKEGVEVEFIKADATKFARNEKFDAAVCLCEGAFSLLGSSDDPIEHDLAILRNVYKSLKPGGKFILTALSALSRVKKATNEEIAKGLFDPNTMTFYEELEAPDGTKVAIRERVYVPTELYLMFRMVGFEVKAIWGGTAGRWGKRKVDMDDIEIMVVAEKPRE